MKFYHLVFALFLFAAPLFAQISLFPLNVGSTWTYEVNATGAEQTGELQVVVSGKENVDGVSCFVLKAIGKKRTGITYVDVNEKGVYIKKVKGESPILGKMDEALSSPIPLLEFPLAAGKTWSWSGNFKILLKQFTFKTSSQVAGKEKVKVPAGIFEAFKVHTKRFVNGKLGGEETRWYAPGVGMVKSKNQQKKLFGLGKNRTILQVLKSYKKG